MRRFIFYTYLTNRRIVYIYHNIYPLNKAYSFVIEELHRELPSSIIPYKEYESEIIIGVIEGLITPETLGYEDYPCEMTMNRWLSEKNRLLKMYF